MKKNIMIFGAILIVVILSISGYYIFIMKDNNSNSNA
jgi:uncharacterized protein YpmB